MAICDCVMIGSGFIEARFGAERSFKRLPYTSVYDVNGNLNAVYLVRSFVGKVLEESIKICCF